MPRNRENQHVEASPHFDGNRDSIINDPLATGGNSTIGIRLNAREEFGSERNPFRYTPKKDKEMERFEKLMRGTKMDK